MAQPQVIPSPHAGNFLLTSSVFLSGRDKLCKKEENKNLHEWNLSQQLFEMSANLFYE
jgi:hypothetical protein